MEKKMKVRKELVVISLVLLLSVAIIFNLIGFDFHPNTLGDFNFIDSMDDFTGFALIVNFIYGIIPNTLQLLSISGITVRLLQTGFSPFVLGFIIAVGSLIGQLLLYGVGLFFYKYVRKKKKGNADATHFLHKYHYLVFLIPSWTGSLGDLIMLIAGHERVNLLKSLPFLFASNLAFAYVNVFWINAQLQ
jgi:membrane protein YqaA with SNARE-associated domain